MRSVRRSALLGLLGGLTVLALPEPAAARGRRVRFSSGRGASQAGSSAAAASTGPVLSREQLRSCMSDQETVERKSAALEQAMASLSEEKSQITEMERRLADEKRLVVASSESSVKRYNAVVDRYQKMVDDYNARVAPFRTDLAAIESARARFNSDCVNHAYDENDMQALMAQR